MTARQGVPSPAASTATVDAGRRGLASPPGAEQVSPPRGSALPALAREFGTPLYVYDLGVVESSYRAFTSAFPYRPVECHYAVVCNKNPVIVRRLHELGAGVHANTPGDAHAAMAAGVTPGRIVYSGTNLDRADFRFLLDRGIHMNLDSVDQVRDLARLASGIAIGLRVLIDDPYGRPNRIGVSPNEVPEAVTAAARGGIRVTGLHMYAGTNTRRVGRFLSCLDRLIDVSRVLDPLEYLDAGGGFGLAYRDGQDPLDLPALGREVVDRMRAVSAGRGREVALLLEPGRIVVGAAGTLVTRVVSVKERGGRRFVGVDTTVGNVVVSSVYHSHHRIEAVEPRGEPLPVATDVCGNTTHSRDFLASAVRLPELRPGDLVALRDVGAYGYAMSSHFLNRPRPPEVVLSDGTALLTTRRETLDDLLTQWEGHP